VKKVMLLILAVLLSIKAISILSTGYQTQAQDVEGDVKYGSVEFVLISIDPPVVVPKPGETGTTKDKPNLDLILAETREVGGQIQLIIQVKGKIGTEPEREGALEWYLPPTYCFVIRISKMESIQEFPETGSLILIFSQDKATYFNTETKSSGPAQFEISGDRLTLKLDRTALGEPAQWVGYASSTQTKLEPGPGSLQLTGYSDHLVISEFI